MAPANRLFKGVTLVGLWGAKQLFSNTPSSREFMDGLATADFSREGKELSTRLSQKGITLLFYILIALVPLFQYLCFLSYQKGWWPFFSFLIFGSLSLLCLGLSEMVLDTNANITPSRWKLLAWSHFIMTIANISFGLWPFWLVGYDGFVFVHGLVITQDIISLIFLLYLHAASHRFQMTAQKSDYNEHV